jgi:hypothetical protein
LVNMTETTCFNLDIFKTHLALYLESQGNFFYKFV